MPQISNLEVPRHLVLRVTWSGGIRAGRTDVVDLAPVINSLKLYRPLREDRLLFRSVHLIEDGRILAWGDDDRIDMPADAVEELAEETMSAEDLRDFLKTYGFTHNEAAAYLDRSRRQIANYLSGDEPIPRIFVMACFGLVARKQILRGPLTRLYSKNLNVQVVDDSSPLPTATEPLPTMSLAPSITIAIPSSSNATSAGQNATGSGLVITSREAS